ncbi:arsenate reductase/protein-tyrosine-phosphatase family protein [Microbacterium trichothecenolyticum]|uniref:Protein-tyrosine-phosphatase n=1 Tax=Microbacterium trichothecenolyticum TaxID=69370 RepID=A0ABU0TUN7_MICTR|nr:ArsR family transcriptional regulator [Microbacterium trichothecenolyticum]MDQ1123373.1 protein-tyrosine-phosphatase [Microbacterium trichothecenolyticum]
MGQLQRRADAFAALADPGRLRIVDLLAHGDLAPSEISRALGMASNLVAFHLGVLVDRGVVRKSRSESDGRRSYVRLVPEVFDTLAPEPVRVRGRVVFICTANSARSQLAEALWNAASAIEAVSAGIDPGAQVNPGAVAAAERHGIVLASDARPRPLQAVARPGDYLITVCDRAHEKLGGIDDVHWSIRDPAVAATPAAFDDTVDELRRRVQFVAMRLVAA